MLWFVGCSVRLRDGVGGPVTRREGGEGQGGKEKEGEGQGERVCVCVCERERE